MLQQFSSANLNGLDGKEEALVEALFETKLANGVDVVCASHQGLISRREAIARAARREDRL